MPGPWLSIVMWAKKYTIENNAMSVCVPSAKSNLLRLAGLKLDIEKSLHVKNAALKRNTLRINSGCFI